MDCIVYTVVCVDTECAGAGQGGTYSRTDCLAAGASDSFHLTERVTAITSHQSAGLLQYFLPTQIVEICM